MRSRLSTQHSGSVKWKGHAQEWHDRLGPTAPPVSVAIPDRLLCDPDVIREVATALRGTGLPPCRLPLEVSEQAVLGGLDERTEDLGGWPIVAGLGTGCLLRPGRTASAVLS